MSGARIHFHHGAGNRFLEHGFDELEAEELYVIETTYFMLRSF